MASEYDIPTSSVVPLQYRPRDTLASWCAKQGMHVQPPAVLQINWHAPAVHKYLYYITVIISSKERFTAAGLGASSLKSYRELYNIHLLDLVDIMYNLEIKHLLLNS